MDTYIPLVILPQKEGGHGGAEHQHGTDGESYSSISQQPTGPRGSFDLCGFQKNQVRRISQNLPFVIPMKAAVCLTRCAKGPKPSLCWIFWCPSIVTLLLVRPENSAASLWRLALCSTVLFDTSVWMTCGGILSFLMLPVGLSCTSVKLKPLFLVGGEKKKEERSELSDKCHHCEGGKLVSVCVLQCD